MSATVVSPHDAGGLATDPTVPAKTAASRLPSLTGLRWIAALMIFCLHIQSESNFFTPDGNAQELLNKVLAAGRSGVSFFFILSGFVLAWSVRPKDTSKAFWWRRFSKIYPNHIVTLLIATAMLAWLGRDFDRRALVHHLLLTQSWVPDDANVWYGFNAVSWSLSCEFFFYLCFPLLYAGLRRLRPIAWWTVGVVCTIGVIVTPLLAKPLSRRTGWSEHYIAYHLPPVRLVEFVLGMALALLVKNGHWRGPGLPTGFALTALGMWVASRLPEQYGLMRDAACTAVGYVVILTAAARSDVRGKNSIWGRPALVRLGEISFAFYLVHEIAIYSMRHVFGDDHPQRPWVAASVLTAATFCLALVAAFLVHDHVERPLMRFLAGRRRVGGGGRARGAARE
jgi:peptidoglycan/LPS O-acetylase OafA/YrhL